MAIKKNRNSNTIYQYLIFKICTLIAKYIFLKKIAESTSAVKKKRIFYIYLSSGYGILKLVSRIIFDEII